MATWHQLQRTIKLYDDTRWTVVDDAPNQCRSMMLFATEDSARAYVARRMALGTGHHVYVLAPATKAE